MNRNTRPMGMNTPTIVVEGDRTDIYLSQAIPLGNDASLHDTLRSRALRHADGEPFWSEALLKDIFTSKRVLTFLKTPSKKNRRPVELCSNGDRNELQTLASTIVRDYVKVFAMLTCIEKQNKFKDLLEAQVDDNSLPLSQVDNVKCLIARADDPEIVLSCFQSWKTASRESFIRTQRRMNPAFLGLAKDGITIRHEIFDPHVLLPFLEDVDQHSGGYGVVAKVKIPADCHGFGNLLKSIVTDDYFALKRIPPRENEDEKAKQEFLGEVEALKRLSGFVHDHLVTLLMTWTIKSQHFLLFPWASKDLESYWSQTRAPINADGVRPDVLSIRWISKQILGMAGALNAIHDPKRLAPGPKYGRHGDIKAENILWYRSPTDEKGILVLADLGLTTFNTTKSRSKVLGKSLSVTPGYRPPECDLEGGVVSRSFDIWTFGCLLLEMACWALGGQELRDQFEEKRTTLYINGCGSNIFFAIEKTEEGKGFVCKVKPEVSEWIANLHARPQCTRYIHDLLDLIENEMVTMISVGKERIRSAALVARLESMHQKVMMPSNEYCQHVCPESRPPRYGDAINAVLNQSASKTLNRVKPSLSRHSGRVETAKSPEELNAMGGNGM